MEFIDPLLDKYVCEHTANESDLLKKINRETHLEVLQPRMLSGVNKSMKMLSNNMAVQKLSTQIKEVNLQALFSLKYL